MSDLAVERYKKSAQRALENFERKCKPVAKELSEKAEELKTKQKNKSPSPEEKKEIDGLKADCAKLKAKLDKFALELKLDLSLIEKPEKGKADEKELLKLPAWLKSVLGKKIVIGNVTIEPDVDIDFKALKINGASLTITFTF
jgi:seryl-tRNA synthetase